MLLMLPVQMAAAPVVLLLTNYLAMSIQMRLLIPLIRAEIGGICTHCGYSLAGNVSGVCPECGRPVPKPKPEIPRYWVKRSLKANIIGVAFSVLLGICLVLVGVYASDRFFTLSIAGTGACVLIAIVCIVDMVQASRWVEKER